MNMNRHWIALVSLMANAVVAQAGLHYSGEQFSELPAQWRGYLLDQRALGALAVPPMAGRPLTPLRAAYEDHRDRLEKAKADGKLTADEAADLGALYIRLGDPDRAATLLRESHRKWPNHFAVAANLGTANQLTNDLTQAIAAMEVGVSLAPPQWKAAEELHLKLLRARSRENKQATGLDLQVSTDDVPSAQMLGLWLPADSRVLWYLGELAHATGDTATAAAILDGCVSDFAMNDTDLRAHRTKYREVASQPHDKHKAVSSTFRFKSMRPLVRKVEGLKLPEIKPDGLNPLPWQLLGLTTIEQPFRPVFVDHLRKLDGKRVVLTGYIQPTGEEAEQTEVLLIEFPVGCWFCEAPEPTSILLVQPAKPARMTREAVRIEGVLKLNTTDPEDRLYTISQAKIGPPE